jgi:hypothetical protein
MPDVSLIVPYAKTGSDAKALVARVTLVQTRAGGKSALPHIPQQAGQWALVGDEVPANGDPLRAGFAWFQACTGINLADPQVARGYGMSAPTPVLLQDAQYNRITAVFLAAGAGGLEALAADINRNLLAATVRDGVYTEVVALRVPDVLSRFGPVPEPAGGWPAFISRNVYNDKVRALDPTPPIYCSQIEERTAKVFDYNRLALNALPGGGVVPVAGRLVRVDVENAKPIPGAAASTYMATYDPAGSATFRAVTEPPGAAASATWQGGEAKGARYAVPLAHAMTPDEPLKDIVATLGSVTLTTKLVIVPKLIITDRVA